MLAGEPPPLSGPAVPLALGKTVAVPVSYHGFYLRDEGVAAPWEWWETMVLSGARVNGLVSNLPELARVSTGTRTGEVDLCVRVVDRREAGLLVVAWDRDKAAARQRKPKARERVDVVFWIGQTPGEQIIQAVSTVGRELAADAQGIWRQLQEEE